MTLAHSNGTTSGMLCSLQQELPQLAPLTIRNRSSFLFIHQDGVEPQLKDRGGEQGDTAAPAEICATLGFMVRDAGLAVHHQQARRTLGWARLPSSHDPETEVTNVAQPAAEWGLRALADRFQQRERRDVAAIREIRRCKLVAW